MMHPNDGQDNIELLVLPSMPNLQEEADNDQDLPSAELNEILKSFMLQVLVQLEQFGDEDEKSEYYKWLKKAVLDPGSDHHNFIKEVQAKKEQSSTISKGINQDVVELMGKYNLVVKKTMESVTLDPGEIFVDGFIYKNQKTFLRACNLESEFYCNDCKGSNTKPLELISHSASTESLVQLFTFQLPDLEGKALLDIGSGLGSILYGAHYFSKASEITGIELNSGFCKIVEKIVTKYGMSKVKVIDGNLKNYADLVRAQDVVVFNNAFEFFMPKALQTELWGFIHGHLKSGSFLVTNPDLESLLKPLGLDYAKCGWVSEMSLQNIDSETFAGLEQTDEQFHVYLVK